MPLPHTMAKPFGQRELLLEITDVRRGGLLGIRARALALSILDPTSDGTEPPIISAVDLKRLGEGKFSVFFFIE
jgi:hypothetical protein